MEKFNIVILGAGASGCMCAMNIAKDKKVLLIDKANLPAKKLMATGNGRCNLTNLNLNTPFAYNQNLASYFDKFNEVETVAFFQRIGLVCTNDEEGRVYPFSFAAKSVIDVIHNTLNQNKNLTLKMNCEFFNLSKDGNLFKISTNQGDFISEQIVVCLSGNKGEEILKKFNIDYKKFTPSLCSLKTEKTKLLENTKISNVQVTAIDKQGNKHTEQGEILFKDSGISGICIFNLSALFAREESFDGKIIIDLMPNYSEKQLKKLLFYRKILNVKVNKVFEGLFTNPIAYHILNTLKLDENKFCSQLTDDEINNIANSIKSLTFTVKGYYDNNQIFAGGASLSALDKNLQSKQIKGLYFCGEICDVDGICGGYNLQWAWTSGKIVADHINLN